MKKQELKKRASMGGKARAEKLSPEERSEVARAAAEARHGTTTPRALCGAPDKPLKIGSIEIACYVLEDGTRVLSQRSLQTGVGMSVSGGKSGEQRLVTFLRSMKSKGLEVSDLVARIRKPIYFVPPGGGRSAYGYEATVLPDLCTAILDARDKGLLQPQQIHLAKQCEILIRGFAHVGIIALVDEATGYQDLRQRNALAEILEAFISDELHKWVLTFPPDFYKEMFRLWGWNYYAGSVKRPAVVGKLTDHLVYERLAPGVLEELRHQTPRNDKGHLKTHLHRRLTREVGHPRLREHLAAVVALMKASPDKEWFMRAINEALPKYHETMRLPLG